jgi:hypothetical protein
MLHGPPGAPLGRGRGTQGDRDAPGVLRARRLRHLHRFAEQRRDLRAVGRLEGAVVPGFEGLVEPAEGGGRVDQPERMTRDAVDHRGRRRAGAGLAQPPRDRLRTEVAGRGHAGGGAVQQGALLRRRQARENRAPRGGDEAFRGIREPRVVRRAERGTELGRIDVRGRGQCLPDEAEVQRQDPDDLRGRRVEQGEAALRAGGHGVRVAAPAGQVAGVVAGVRGRQVLDLARARERVVEGGELGARERRPARDDDVPAGERGVRQRGEDLGREPVRVVHHDRAVGREDGVHRRRGRARETDAEVGGELPEAVGAARAVHADDHGHPRHMIGVRHAMDRRRCLDRRGLRSQDQCEQAGEAGVELRTAEPVEAPGAGVALLEEAGVAQDREVVAAGRLAHRDVDAAAGERPVRDAGQLAQDVPADRVADRLERGLQRDAPRVGVRERGAAAGRGAPGRGRRGG